MPLDSASTSSDSEFPPHLLQVPGFIDQVTQHTLATAHKRQPALALGGALALLGTLTGRKVCDELNTRTNVYCLGVCPSGWGKEQPHRVNRELLLLAGAAEFIGPEGFASHAGLISAVERQPSILFQLDQPGRLLQAASDPDRAPHLYHSIVSTLMSLFTSSCTVFNGNRYTTDTKKSIVVDQPNACVLGTTSPKAFNESLTVESISGGFMSRVLAFEASQTPPKKQRPDRSPLPDAAIAMTRWWARFSPPGNLHKETPQPLVVHTEAAAASKFDAVDDLAYQREAMLREPLGTLWTRVTEKARKLALLYACSADHEQPRIDSDAAQWACELSLYLTERMIYLASHRIAENSLRAKSECVGQTNKPSL